VYTNVEVNETKISALIDTGSSRSVISKSVVQKLKLDMEDVEPIKLVVGNNEILTMDEIANVSLKIGDGLSATEKFYISNCCPEDLVLGNDFLKNQGCVINFRNMTLTSGKTKIQLVSRSEQLGRVNEVDKLFFSKVDENQVFEPDDEKLNKMSQKDK
jgi:predicted aspartyl protease